MMHFLDNEAHVALATGKEKLAKERAAVSGTEPSNKLAVHDPTVSASSTDINVVASSLPSQVAKIISASVKGETRAITEQASQKKKDESDDAQ